MHDYFKEIHFFQKPPGLATVARHHVCHFYHLLQAFVNCEAFFIDFGSIKCSQKASIDLHLYITVCHNGLR